MHVGLDRISDKLDYPVQVRSVRSIHINIMVHKFHQISGNRKLLFRSGQYCRVVRSAPSSVTYRIFQLKSEGMVTGLEKICIELLKFRMAQEGAKRGERERQKERERETETEERLRERCRDKYI